MVLCIYHGNCADGFGAAWAVREALGDRVEFHAGVYQDPPPDVDGLDVVLVDFSYKRDVITSICGAARSVLVLDHHKSAYEDLTGSKVRKDMGTVEFTLGGGRQCNAVFDMERSGAMIAWDNFHPGKEPPPLLHHIQDRDLWRFQLEGTREIQAAVFSYPYDFAVWDRLMQTPVAELHAEGVAIERKHHKDIAELVKVCKRPMRIGGHVVPAASLPYTLTSDAGHLMCQPFDDGLNGAVTPPFAACYWDTPEGRVFSLRSVDELGGVDVSEIAKQYGGGGHKNAAGFRVPLDQITQFE